MKKAIKKYHFYQYKSTMLGAPICLQSLACGRHMQNLLCIFSFFPVCWIYLYKTDTVLYLNGAKLFSSFLRSEIPLRFAEHLESDHVLFNCC